MPPISRSHHKGCHELLDYGEEAVSVGFEEVSADAWRDKVYLPDIVAKDTTLYKKPGYRM